MPRFENDGFNPNMRDRLDRTVPAEENYYGMDPLDFGSRDNPVIDNQNLGGGVNPCNDYGQAQYQQPQQRFVSERPEDFGQARPNPQYAGQYRQQQRQPQNYQRPPKKQSKAKKKRKQRKLIISSIAMLLVLILVGTTLFGMLALGRMNHIDKVENNYVNQASLIHDDSVKNILLLGVDARNDENPEETRSDTMMLVSVDTINHEVKLTSFLRDSWVYIPTLEHDQRLNAACSSGGYQGVVDAIEYNFGVDVDGYAVVDFEMFKVLVDTLGGVKVDVTEEEANEVTNNPERYGWVELESGEYELTGEQALAYCRIRKIDTDFVRTERQRTVMTEILNKTKHSTPTKLVRMLYNSAPYISTDLTSSELISIAFSAISCLGEIRQEKVPFEGTWNYQTIDGNSVIGIDTEENAQMLQDYIYG